MNSLAKSPLFAGLTSEELQNILDTHTVHSFNKGEIIFHAMQKAQQLAIILDGKVEAQKTFPNGNHINVSIFQQGEMIGTASVFSQSPYPCDIVALSKVSLLILHKNDLLSLMQSNITILENITCELAIKTYKLQQRLELLSYSGIAEKLAFWLLMQQRQTGKSRITIPRSVSNLATFMNVSRTSLHRELARLSSQRIIAYSPPYIDILDEDGLLEILE